MTLDNTQYPVNGRELHKRLEIDTPYTMWFKRMCAYGFEEGKDFETDNKNVYRANGTQMPQQSVDHNLTVAMAKELCMLQRTDIGKQVRTYLIQIEESWNTPDMVIARGYKLLYDKAQRLEAENAQLSNENFGLTLQRDDLRERTRKLAPKAAYYDVAMDTAGLTTLRETAKLLGTGEKAMIDALIEAGWIYRTKSGKLLPYKGAKGFVVKEYPNEEGTFTGVQTMVTIEGRKAIAELQQPTNEEEEA